MSMCRIPRVVATPVSIAISFHRWEKKAPSSMSASTKAANLPTTSSSIYGLNGEWEVENHGIAPDVEVDLDPAAYRQGHDAQLEKAIEVVMQQLKEHPLPEIKRPPYPNYHEHDDLGAK